MNALEIYDNYMDKNPAISVGSGNGVFERFINVVLKINVTCIDPLTMKEWGKVCPLGMKPK